MRNIYAILAGTKTREGKTTLENGGQTQQTRQQMWRPSCLAAKLEKRGSFQARILEEKWAEAT